MPITERQIDVRSFISILPEGFKTQLDDHSRRIKRHKIKGHLGFDESLLDHTSRLVSQAQTIAEKKPYLRQHINMPTVANMLYFHEVGKLSLAEKKADIERKMDAHSTLRRDHRKKREREYFEKNILQTIPEELRPEVINSYTRYNENNPHDKEAQLAHFIDKADIALIALNHFENPLYFDNGHDPSRHVKNIEQMLKPMENLLKLVSLEEQIELLQLIAVVKESFFNSGYSLNTRVMNLFDKFIIDAFKKE